MDHTDINTQKQIGYTSAHILNKLIINIKMGSQKFGSHRFKQTHTNLVEVKEDVSNVQDSLYSLFWVRVCVLVVVWEISVQSHLPTNSRVL